MRDVDNVTSPWSVNSSDATPSNDNNYNNSYDDDDDDDDALESSMSRDAAVALVRFVFPLIVFVGTTGNALSAAVMLICRP